MILLVVLMVVLYLVLSGLLAAWTVWFSGYLYEQPTDHIEWRGPAAGGAVFAATLLWVVMAYNSPGSYRPLWEFSSSEVSPPFKELYVPNDAGEVERYRLIGGKREYRLNGNENLKPLTSRPAVIVVKEDGKERTFKLERDEKGRPLHRKTRTLFGSTDETPRYVDEGGYVMLADSIGQVTTFKGGNFVLNLFLNFLLLGAWFAALWLLLKFQWSHALGQAVVFWLVMCLFVVPQILSYAERVAKERSRPAETAGPGRG